jgi:hypothetical protein
MSKQWYYEIMGSTLGPISSADLKHKVQQGQILPETPIRMGVDGKWQSADRIKGLLDAPPPAAATPKPQAPSPPPVAAAPAPATKPPAEPAPLRFPLRTAAEPQPAPEPPRIQLAGGPVDDEPSATAEPAEYDFFRFVGFEQALGTPLHAALNAYCHQHHLTMTQATRRAIATLVDRRDLSGDSPPPAPAAPSGSPPANPVSS